MFFSSSFQLAPYLVQLLLAVAVLYFIIVKWESSTTKTLMSVVVALGFLLPALLAFVSTLVFNAAVNSYNNSGYQFLQLFAGIVSIVGGVLPMLALVVLLIYVLQRSKLDFERFRFLHAVVDDSTPNPHPYVAMGFIPARAWSTDVDPKLRIGILRRREWAFLIDVLPVIAFNISCLWILSKTRDGYMESPMEGLLGGLFWLATLGLIVYLPFKDAIGGVSFGKMFTKCRVVRTRDGVPIGVAQSVGRNILFLVPLMPIVELAVASLRPDRKRLGDLLASTTVVTGAPDFVDGAENQGKQVEPVEAEVRPHPLDD